jgi:hypothetical protein
METCLDYKKVIQNSFRKASEFGVQIPSTKPVTDFEVPGRAQPIVLTIVYILLLRSPETIPALQTPVISIDNGIEFGGGAAKCVP